MPGGPHAVELDLPFERVLPDRLRPMLPMAAPDAFVSNAHLFEVFWDGVRALAFKEHGETRLWGRARELTGQYPEVRALGDLLPPETIVDGELIVADAAGRPDLAALQEREHADRSPVVAAAARAHPVTYVVYDLLYLRGRSLLREPLHRRRTALKQVMATSGRVYVAETFAADGVAFFDAAREKGLEGIVAKRLDGLYHPGRRHPDWLLIQTACREDFAVLGFVPGKGEHHLEGLVVGSFDGSGFKPVGKVVGGYEPRAAARLRTGLDRLPAVLAPKDEPWASLDVHWVEPRLVVCVKFSEWDRNGNLRFPIYCGLRLEVSPQECVRTPVIDPARPARARRPEIQLPRLPI